MPREAGRGVGPDGPLAMHDLVDLARRHTDRDRERALRIPRSSVKSVTKISPGWIASIGLLSVAVDWFDIVSTPST